MASSTARPVMGQTSEKKDVVGTMCVRRNSMCSQNGHTGPDTSTPSAVLLRPPWNLGSSTRWGWLDRATGLKQGQRDTVAFRVIFFPVAIMTLEMKMQQRACNSADYSSTCIVCLTSAT